MIKELQNYVPSLSRAELDKMLAKRNRGWHKLEDRKKYPQIYELSKLSCDRWLRPTYASIKVSYTGKVYAAGELIPTPQPYNVEA